MTTPDSAWYRVANADEVYSPALLVYPDRVERNIRRMVELASGAERLRPHMKTHKTAEIIALQRQLGITKCKCATIAEAELAARCGVEHVLVAYQPAGPNVRRLLALAAAFPRTQFATIVDDAVTVRALTAAARAAERELELLLDIDCGMHRTGVAPDDRAVDLYQLIQDTPGVRPGGLHAYDGHICDHDPALRQQAAVAALAPVKALGRQLRARGCDVPRIVAGGSPTFSIHAADADIECSPGTCVLWDAGYGAVLPDLGFAPAAVVLTRVVSKPGNGRVCLDLGYKAVASEGPHPRVLFPDLPDARAVGHNEEHLVIETTHAPGIAVGEAFYGIPWHICPTVALHAAAVVVRGGRAAERWRVVARDRILTY